MALPRETNTKTDVIYVPGYVLLCDICKKTFEDDREFSIHMAKWDHRRYLSPRAIKSYRYKCVRCGKIFKSVAQVKNHFKTHLRVFQLKRESDLHLHVVS